MEVLIGLNAIASAILLSRYGDTLEERARINEPGLFTNISIPANFTIGSNGNPCLERALDNRELTRTCFPAFWLFSCTCCDHEALSKAVSAHEKVDMTHGNAFREVESLQHWQQRLGAFTSPSDHILGGEDGFSLNFSPEFNSRLHRFYGQYYWGCKKNPAAGCHTKSGWNHTCITECRSNGMLEQYQRIGPGVLGKDLTPPFLMRQFYGAGVPRFITLLRNPVDGLHEGFATAQSLGMWNFYKGGASPDGFHNFAVDQVSGLARCVAATSTRHCSLYFSRSRTEDFNKVPWDCLLVLRALHMWPVLDWVAAFPGRVMAERIEDLMAETVADRRTVLQRVFQFLGIPAGPSQWEAVEAVLAKLPSYSAWHTKQVTPVHNVTTGVVKKETLCFLHNFFGLYNQELVRILQDGKFKWEDAREAVVDSDCVGIEFNRSALPQGLSKSIAREFAAYKPQT